MILSEKGVSNVNCPININQHNWISIPQMPPFAPALLPGDWGITCKRKLFSTCFNQTSFLRTFRGHELHVEDFGPRASKNIEITWDNKKHSKNIGATIHKTIHDSTKTGAEFLSRQGPGLCRLVAIAQHVQQIVWGHEVETWEGTLLTVLASHWGWRVVLHMKILEYSSWWTWFPQVLVFFEWCFPNYVLPGGNGFFKVPIWWMVFFMATGSSTLVKKKEPFRNLYCGLESNVLPKYWWPKYEIFEFDDVSIFQKEKGIRYTMYFHVLSSFVHNQWIKVSKCQQIASLHSESQTPWSRSKPSDTFPKRLGPSPTSGRCCLNVSKRCCKPHMSYMR